MGSLDKDTPMEGPQAAERNETGQPAERVSDLGFHYIGFFFLNSTLLLGREGRGVLQQKHWNCGSS